MDKVSQQRGFGERNYANRAVSRKAFKALIRVSSYDGKLEGHRRENPKPPPNLLKH